MKGQKKMKQQLKGNYSVVLPIKENMITLTEAFKKATLILKKIIEDSNACKTSTDGIIWADIEDIKIMKSNNSEGNKGKKPIT